MSGPDFTLASCVTRLLANKAARGIIVHEQLKIWAQAGEEARRRQREAEAQRNRPSTTTTGAAFYWPSAY